MNAAATSWWTTTSVAPLEQGDLLADILVPEIPTTFSESDSTIDTIVTDVIVLSQSCDLLNGRVKDVLLGRVLTSSEASSAFTADKLDSIRVGRVTSHHMLVVPDAEWKARHLSPGQTAERLHDIILIDFTQLYNLPLAYVQTQAARQSPRWRLNSPYREHLSQAFARIWMRVGLPSDIPPIKKKT